MNIRKKNQIKTIGVCIWMLFCLSLSLDGFAQTSSSYATTTCPDGFAPIPSGLACAAVNLTSDAGLDYPPGSVCPAGFERPAGVRFCVAKNLSLDIQDDIILLASLNNGNCPVGFSRAIGSTICTADNLVLEIDENEVKLTQFVSDCNKGFHRPVGSRFCVAKNVTSGVLPAPPTQNCPAGFIKPPGVHFCIASNMVYADDTRLNDLPPPKGLCPEGWHKPRNVNLCIPENETRGCGKNCGTEYAAIEIIPLIDDFKATPCPKGTVEIWWDMPKYDDDGLFVVDLIPTRTCIPEGLEPAG